MNWRDIVAHWLKKKGVVLGEELKIMELVELMKEKDIIPSWLVGNDTLNTILLTQVMWETMKGIVVPRAHQGSNFTYYLNAKEMMNQDMAKKSGLQFLALEKETGVNLDSYYKLKIKNTISWKPIPPTRGESLNTEIVVDKEISFGEYLDQDMKKLRKDIKKIYN